MMKLAILVPSHDTWVADFAISVLALQQYLGHHPPAEEFQLNLVNERGSLITYQRENLAEKALEQEVTHVLWLDSDMRFPPNLVHQLLRHDLPMVACNYVKRTIPAMPNAKNLEGKLISTKRDSHGLVEAESSGFGAVLMKIEVFKQIPKPWFDLVWLDKNGKTEMMGEDVFFFRKARHHGIPLFIDHDASQKISHIGSFEYDNALCEATWDEVDHKDLKQAMMG